MTSKIRLADLIKGNGAEFVIIGTGAPVIISGGQRLSLELKIEQDNASIALKSADSETVLEVCKGSVAEITSTYNDFLNELRRKGDPSFIQRHSKFLLGGVTGLILATVILLATGPLSSKAPPPSLQPTNQNAEMLKFIEALASGVAPGVETRTPPIPGLENKNDPIKSILPPVLEKPDFLQKPAIPTSPAPAAVAPAIDTDVKEIITEEEPKNFPVYDPNAYTTPAVEPKTEPTPIETTPVAPAPTEEIKEPEKNVPVVEEPKNDEKPLEPVKTEPTPNPQTPASDNTQNEAPTPEQQSSVTPSEEETLDDQVISSLVGSGMSQNEANDVQKTLEALSMMEFDAISPEMIKKLPHEVALMLRQNGLIGDGMEAFDTDGTPHRIIKLPNDVVDKYRGKDGIASIPEANSWIATGNTVKIPLPGGGDLRTKEDFARFGIDLKRDYLNYE